MTTKFYGGIDIAMKVPLYQYQAMIAFYCACVSGQIPTLSCTLTR